MLEQLKNNWDQSSLLKRASLIIGLVLILAMLVGSAFWALKDDYQVLFTDLNAQDASSMIDELERLKIPYQLSDNGTTILVERDLVYKTRLKLMGKGLNLNGSVGFEIFNNSEFGMTEFSQKVNYQRALQGELVRTIMAFDEIKSARVHLVLPESGLFKRQNAKPKASVSILMKDDNALTAQQITGIQRLVAASVPEINPSEVTVIDQRGVALTKQFVALDSEAALPERLEMKKQLEDYMTRKIVTVVDRAVGPGKAIVSVDVALNYDQIKIVKEDIVPLPNTAGQEVGAISHKKESYQGDDNLGELSTFSTGQSKSTSNVGSSSSTELEFINSKRVEQVMSSPGNILRLSVGVLLPDTSDQIKIAKLKDMISMSVGINTARGDGLAVYSVDMEGDKSLTGKDIPTEKTLDINPVSVLKNDKPGYKMPDIVIYCLLGGLGLIVLMLLLNKRKLQTRPKLSEDARAAMLDEISVWAKASKSI